MLEKTRTICSSSYISAQIKKYGNLRKDINKQIEFQKHGFLLNSQYDVNSITGNVALC